MTVPLSEELRPKILEEIVGQDHLVGSEGFITTLIEQNRPLSILLWGPPGCGKTSIARLYAQAFDIRFECISPIFHGVADLKKLLKESDKQSPLLLFVDEIHRFNKSQQDAFLPFLENGSLVLIGATVENPSFYLNDALLSRMRVLKLHALQKENLHHMLNRYETVKKPLRLQQEAKDFIIQLAQGDGRFLFNLIENIEACFKKDTLLSVADIENYLQKKSALFDKGSDQHYNLISALHKAVRGSDPDASLYWLSRILNGGEEPLFVARRIIRMAVEDIGLADPQALGIAVAARDAYEMLGSPEGELALAQAVVYLAIAPKSNAVYTAFKDSLHIAKETSELDPPYIILNAPTKLMKNIGYGQGYIYDHSLSSGFSGQNYFPNALPRQEFYKPVSRGFEKEAIKRLEYFSKLRERFSK